MSSFLGELPALLVELRKRSGMSQKAFGDAAGVSWRSIADYERGTTDPKVGVFLRMLEAGGVRSLGELQRLADGVAGRESPREPHFRPDDVARAFPSSPADLHRRLADLYEEIETVTRRLGEAREEKPKK